MPPVFKIPLWPCASDYDLHQSAGGLPLRILTAPNVRSMSKHAAGGLQNEQEVKHPY